ncbi:MAG: hypothetical protein ACOYOS_00085 [Syntrophales bacterium]
MKEREVMYGEEMKAKLDPRQVMAGCAFQEEPVPVEDPWKHRSKEMRCATCMWFVGKQPSNLSACYDIGRCRRHAPTMNGYPVVFVRDWCGDHKLDENKL